MKISKLFLLVSFFLMTKGLFAQKSNSADTLASAFTNGTVGNSPAWPAITLASPDKVELAGPEFKTHPNTLRPIPRRNGEWTVADPVALPKEIRRGETYHITTECRGNRIKVFVDGEEVYEQSDDGFHRGAVGFCVSAPLDQGLFENIRLQK